MRLVKDPTSDNPYLRAGFPDRTAYLKDLAQAYGVRYTTVKRAADMLGEDEDFDALVSFLNEVSPC